MRRSLWAPFESGWILSVLCCWLLCSCGAGSGSHEANVRVQALRLVSGEPLVEAEVLFLDGEGSVQSDRFFTDDAGLVEAYLPAGDYQVHLRAWRHDILPGAVAGATDFSVSASGLTTVIVEPALREGLGGTGWADIVVEDENGSPVGGALVIAYNEEQCNLDTGRSWGYADPQGQVRITNLAPGVYTLKAYARSLGPQYVGSATVESAKGNETPARVGVHGSGLATVFGSVTPAPGTTPITIALHEPLTGAVIPGTRIRVEGPDFQWESVPPGRFFAKTVTDAGAQVLSPDDIQQSSLATVRAASSCTPNEVRVEGVSVHTVDGGELSISVPMVQAVEVVRPNAAALVEAPPEMLWSVFPNVDYYVVEVRDSSGHVVFGGFALDETPRLKVPANMAALSYGDLTHANVDPGYIPAENLVGGRVYDWRVFACKDDSSTTRGYRIASASALGAGRFIFAPPDEE